MLIISLRSAARIKLPLHLRSTVIPPPAKVMQLSITGIKFRKQVVSRF